MKIFFYVPNFCHKSVDRYPALEQKLVQHGPKTIAFGCNNDLFLLIFEEKWPNYASGPKSAPNRGSFWVRQLFNVCVRVFCTPNAAILPPRSKGAPSEKDDFFAKIVIFCKSITGPLSEAYTQPYSFGERIKLIICQIRHGLCVTIHERSTSWRKR